MSEWPEIALDELKASTPNAIAMGPFGSRIKVENFVEEGIPVIKGGNLTGSFIVEDKFDFLTEEKTDELKASNAFPLDIVITHRGTIGQVGIIPDNAKYDRYVVSQSQLKVSLNKDRVNPYFIYYFLRSPLGQHRLLENASQVGVPAIAQASTSVKKILVPGASKKEQDDIVKILLDIDHKIELDRKMNKTLEAMAQSIFKSWFIDFDWIRQNQPSPLPPLPEGEGNSGGMSNKSPLPLGEGLGEGDAVLVDSELGPIPKGWKVKNLGELARVSTGKRQKSRVSEKDSDHQVPLVGGAGQIAWTKDALFTQPVITTGRVGTLGIVLLWNKPIWPSDNALVVSADDSCWIEFLYHHMMRKDLVNLNRGSTQPMLTQKDIKNIRFAVPPLELLQHFADVVEPLRKHIEFNLQESITLANLRDTLLPKLISGEVRVPEAKHDVEALCH